MPGNAKQIFTDSHDGQVVKAFIIFCADCAESTVQYSAAGSNPIDAPTAQRWAREMGWRTRGGRWRCPAHAAKPTN